MFRRCYANLYSELGLLVVHVFYDNLLKMVNISNCVFMTVLIQTRALQPVATSRQSPYLHKPAVIIMSDVILVMTSHAYAVSYGARSPRSHSL